MMHHTYFDVMNALSDHEPRVLPQARTHVIDHARSARLRQTSSQSQAVSTLPDRTAVLAARLQVVEKQL
jgi:hypothetical protein